MNKVVRNGLVAVIVSEGFGAGWSTWNDAEDAFDPEVVRWIEGGKVGEPLKVGDRRYKGGLNKARIVWLPLGTLFRIDEYDGSETLITLEDEEYMRC